MQLPWAFRGDIDHIDSLKTLPVAPLALATGELAGGVMVLAAIQLVLLGRPARHGGESADRPGPPRHSLVPFDVLMLGMSNLLFLIYPVRDRAVDLGRLSALRPHDAVHAAPIPDPDSHPGHSRGHRGHRLLCQRLLAGRRSPSRRGWCSWPSYRCYCLALAWTFQRFDPSTETPA